jgi:hypothetical protein
VRLLDAAAADDQGAEVAWAAVLELDGSAERRERLAEWAEEEGRPAVNGAASGNESTLPGAGATGSAPAVGRRPWHRVWRVAVLATPSAAAGWRAAFGTKGPWLDGPFASG